MNVNGSTGLNEKLGAGGQEADCNLPRSRVNSRAGHDFIWRREAGSIKESLARGRAYRDAYSAMN